MDTSWNNLGKAFWKGGIFGVAQILLNEMNQPSASAPPPLTPPPAQARPTVFVFGMDCPLVGLKHWAEHLRKVKDSLSANPDLLELSRAMLRSGLSKAECEQWVDIAHEIKDFMGVDNLCEVPVRIDL